MRSVYNSYIYCNAKSQKQLLTMNEEKIDVYLGLGGNEGQVLERLKKAIDLLASHKTIHHLKYSHFYLTAPQNIEDPNAPPFVNAVCTFKTNLSISEIFEITQAIEILLGKVKKPKNYNRPIDIDLLFYGDQVFQNDTLQIPHPKWNERLFVLIPLSNLTNEIFICQNSKQKRYILSELIQIQRDISPQDVSLLEKNPHLK